MKNILVTGGAGFVGSHLCEELSKNSLYKLISLDNYSSGSKKNHIKGVTYLQGNCKEISSLINEKIDLIYHLGEYSRVEQSFDDIDKVWDFNVSSILEVLKFTKKNNAKIVYSGSSTKFTKNKTGKELSPYAFSKAMNTEMVKNYAAWYGLDFAVTYFYNVYGGREIRTGSYATVIGIFCDKYLKSEPLTVVKPGVQKRNFTHIDDIVSALILIGKHGIGDHYGIGNKQSYSLMEVAKMFGSEVKMLPERKGNRLDADLLTDKTENLGWKPNRNLESFILNFKNSN